ncbi:MAG: hypothetical protein GIKADHBN_00442 [Phycisphaerales bacterium]|nr:hypothetical protein [Phycisphaerales bacterium]
MSNRDDTRMDFIALKLKAGLPLSAEEQAYWEQRVHLGDKIKAGLPLTPEEAEKVERAKEAIVTVRNGSVWVESPPLTTDQWKQAVAKSRAAPAKLVADADAENAGKQAKN